MEKRRTPKIDTRGLIPLPFPAEIAIETHAHCNLSCIFCPYAGLQREKGRMDPGLFHKIIDEVALESPETRLWLAIMGEPLMDKRILSFLNYAYDRGARRVHLNTNGTPLKGRLAEEILGSGIEAIYISIDAMTKATFDRVRPGGDFEKIKSNAEKFLEMHANHSGPKPEVCLQFIVMEENESEMEEFERYWLDLGAVVKLRLRQGWGSHISAPDLERMGIERIPCPWLIRTMNVHWTGAVTQCDPDYEEKYPAGNLIEQSIKEIWNGELKKRRERHWAKDFSHPLCVNCNDWAAGRAEFSYPTERSALSAPRWSLGEKK